MWYGHPCAALRTGAMPLSLKARHLAQSPFRILAAIILRYHIMELSWNEITELCYGVKLRNYRVNRTKGPPGRPVQKRARFPFIYYI